MPLLPTETSISVLVATCKVWPQRFDPLSNRGNHKHYGRNQDGRGLTLTGPDITEVKPMPRRVPSRYWAVILALAMALPTPTPVRGGSDAQLVDAAQFREQFGLATDPQLIKDLLADASALRTYSTPLTAEEEQALSRRFEIHAQLDPVRRYAETFASFGGGYLDQAAGGVVVLTFTQDLEVHEAAARRLLPSDALLQVRRVPNSLVELNQLQAAVLADVSSADPAATEVNRVSVDVIGNVVEVGVSSFSTQVMDGLERKYGEGKIHVIAADPAQLAACNNRDDCIGPPFRAGISTTYGCTLGFGARHTSGVYRFITAGHCIENNSNASWYHGPLRQLLGSDRYEAFYSGTYADAGSIGDVSTGNKSNLLFISNANKSARVTSVQCANCDWVGQAICQSGRVSLYTCGQITRRGVSLQAQNGY